VKTAAAQIGVIMLDTAFPRPCGASSPRNRNPPCSRGRLLRGAPQVRSVVLECTNFGPYRNALSRALGLPEHGIVEALTDPAFQ